MHVLIVGSVREPHQYLYDKNIEVSWVINRSFQFSDDVRLSYERMFAYNSSDPHSLILSFIGQLNTHKMIDAVCCFHDAAQPLALKITSLLGLPFRVSEETLSLSRDKLFMRDHLRRHEFEKVVFRICANRDEVRDFVNDNELSGCVLKPRDGSGSAGVIKVTDISELSSGLVGYDFPCIAEEQFRGSEFSVEAFSHSRKHTVLGITQKFTDSETCIESGHLFPAPLADYQTHEITKYCLNFLDIIEVTDGPTHTEVMLTEDGPRIIETHTRAGGDSIPSLVYQVTGIDIHKLNAMQQLGEDVSGLLKDISYSGFSQVGFLLPETVGEKVVSIEGFSNVYDEPYVVERKCNYVPGEMVRPLKSSFDRVGHVLVKGSTASECAYFLDKELSCCKLNF